MTSRLKRIFIRAQMLEGGWGSLDLERVTDQQFNEWYGGWIIKSFSNDRLKAIELLDVMGIPPVELKDKEKK